MHTVRWDYKACFCTSVANGLTISDNPQLLVKVNMALAVTSFSKKINVYQHSGDWERSRPQGQKNVHNLLMPLRKMSWACNLVAEMLLIQNKTIFDLNIRGQVLDMTIQRNVPWFCMRSICEWNLFQPLRLNLARGYEAWLYHCYHHPLQAANFCRNSQIVVNEWT